MGIYDKLSQLDKNQPPLPGQQTKESTSLNPEPEQTKPTPLIKTATPKQKSQKTRLSENKKVRKQESQKTRLPESKKAVLPARNQEQLLDEIQPYLDLKASNMVSFRYPDTLIAWLEESLYWLKKQYGKKLTKNALLVAALAYVLWDLEQNSQASFLYQQFIQEKEEV
jgi:hypothetical protein